MICNILWQWCICVYNEQIPRQNLSLKPHLNVHMVPIITQSWGLDQPRLLIAYLSEQHVLLNLGVCPEDLNACYAECTDSSVCTSTPTHSPSFSLLSCSLEGWALQTASPRAPRMGGERLGVLLPCCLLFVTPALGQSCFPPWHAGKAGQPYLTSSSLWAPETLFPPLVPSLGKVEASYCCWSRFFTWLAYSLTPV